MPSKLRNNNARFSLPSQIAVLKSTENLPSHCQLNDMEQSDKSAAKSPTPNTSHSHGKKTIRYPIKKYFLLELKYTAWEEDLIAVSISFCPLCYKL